MEFEEVEVNSERWFDLAPLKNEEFRDIENYEGLYQISNYGRVKSLKRFITNQYGERDKILIAGKSKCGYLFVNLCQKNNKKNFLTHRLVANHFICNPDNKLTVNHIDGNKLNNRVDNLEWMTHKEQTHHAICNGLIKNNDRDWTKFALMGQISNSKIVIQYDLQHNFIKKYKSVGEAERITGINHSNIIMCCNGKRKTAGGYLWEYYKGDD